MRTKIWGQRSMALFPGLRCLCTPVPSPHPPREAPQQCLVPSAGPFVPPVPVFLFLCILAPFFCSKFSVNFSFLCSFSFFNFFFYKLICFQFHLVNACVLLPVAAREGATFLESLTGHLPQAHRCQSLATKGQRQPSI